MMKEKIIFEGIGLSKERVTDLEKGFYDYVEKQRLKQERKITRIKKKERRGQGWAQKKINI